MASSRQTFNESTSSNEDDKRNETTWLLLHVISFCASLALLVYEIWSNFHHIVCIFVLLYVSDYCLSRLRNYVSHVKTCVIESKEAQVASRSQRNEIDEESEKITQLIQKCSIAMDFVLKLGKDAIREKVLCALTHENLQLSLEAVKQDKERFQKFKLYKEQSNIIFPRHGKPPNLDDIDVTLWAQIARHVTKDCDKFKWDKKLEDDDIAWQHDVIRLRIARNKLQHSSTISQLANVVDQLLHEIEPALLRLGVSEEIIDNIRHQKTVSSFLTFKPEEAIVNLQTEFGTIKFLPRVGWRAVPPHRKTSLRTPVQYVIISHTAETASSRPAETPEACCASVLLVQRSHMQFNKWDDIGFNFLVGNDGVIYEGRGWEHEGAFALGWNNESLGIAFIGNYDSDTLPSEAALDVLALFLKYLVASGKLQPQYTLYALRQVRPFPYAPGNKLFELMKTWPHWENKAYQQT